MLDNPTHAMEHTNKRAAQASLDPETHIIRRGQRGSGALGCCWGLFSHLEMPTPRKPDFELGSRTHAEAHPTLTWGIWQAM